MNQQQELVISPYFLAAIKLYRRRRELEEFSREMEELIRRVERELG